MILEMPVTYPVKNRYRQAAKSSRFRVMVIVPYARKGAEMQNTIDTERKRINFYAAKIQDERALHAISALLKDLAEKEPQKPAEVTPVVTSAKDPEPQKAYTKADLIAVCESIERSDQINFFTRLILQTLENQRNQWESSPFNPKNPPDISAETV